MCARCDVSRHLTPTSDANKTGNYLVIVLSQKLIEYFYLN